MTNLGTQRVSHDPRLQWGAFLRHSHHRNVFRIPSVRRYTSVGIRASPFRRSWRITKTTGLGFISRTRGCWSQPPRAIGLGSTPSTWPVIHCTIQMSLRQHVRFLGKHIIHFFKVRSLRANLFRYHLFLWCQKPKWMLVHDNMESVILVANL